MRHLREFPVEDSDDEVAVGDKVLVGIFKEQDKVTITGISKGAGFAGVMKRHGFRGGRATHGSMFHRAPGSIGCSASPSRVFKGRKLPGQKGAKQVTVKALEVVKVDEEKNLLLVKGAVPGSRGGYLMIRRATSL
jgi:large subunit ribosomal protein L3